METLPQKVKYKTKLLKQILKTPISRVEQESWLAFLIFFGGYIKFMELPPHDGVISAGLAGQLPASTGLCFPSARIQACITLPGFHMGTGDPIQALHPLSHLPAPKGSLRVFAGEKITSVFTKTRKYIPTYLDSNMTRSSN